MLKIKVSRCGRFMHVTGAKGRKTTPEEEQQLRKAIAEHLVKRQKDNR